MTAKRIAFVCPRFSETATVGGAETLLKSLAMRAAAAGRDVSFLTTCATNHFTWANETPQGTTSFGRLKVTRFPVNEDRDIATFLRVQERISRSIPVPRDDELAWLANNVNSDALQEHLRSPAGSYDKIVTGPYLFGLTYFTAMAHSARTVLVPCLHDEPFAGLATIGDMFKTVRGFMFNTEPERDLACRLYGDRFASMPVVGMGIDDFTTDPTAFRRKHGMIAPYVVYSGRREPLKGTPMLLDYLAAFRGRTGRDIRIVFTGSGPIEPPRELAPAVIDLGFVSEQEKHEAMAGATAFCHPSVNESLGIVLLESWLAGTPALVNGSCDVLRHQCAAANGGLWFRNYPEFEEELALLMDNAELRGRMGQAGRQFVLNRYSWKSVEDRMFKALDA